MTDEKETGVIVDALPPERELTVAEQEALSREKHTAEQAKSAPESSTKAGAPEVNKLKPRRQNRMLFVLVALLAGLIFAAWAMGWFYTNFLKTEPDTPESASLSSSNAPPQRRSGMGAEVKPFAVDEPEAPTEFTGMTTGDNRLPSLPAAPSFNKTRALVGDGSAPAPARTAALSRVNERAISTGEATTAATVAPEATKGGVTRIPFNPDLYVPENTYIPCTLQTRFVSDVAGRISCNISEDVYSANGHTLLIEKGTKAKGVYKTGTLKAGQSRMFIIWTELRTPDAKKIALVDTQVVGQLGEAGIDGWIDTHFWERFGNTMLLSSVSDLAAAATGGSPSRDRNTDYTENTRAAAAEMAKIALENSINIPPTIYKNQGDIIGMLVGEDIDFSSIYALRMK
ncbi:TPA: VirB10/TraB/TrbI family type IV secretion system protein [Yersinia enterocolitica]|uniref:VirB10/TraB/TrbI family type IV secretion system protein n=1 Tax=Yersinia massiliensis TaxID=419257 RepID=UPI0020B88664|nr:VirB10/TraB/TrbI family type IV secretion system protein [Yersinia massiliensis]